MHGGTVEARSAGVGEGSEFVVRLPLAREYSEEVRPPNVVATSGTRGGALLSLMTTAMSQPVWA